MSGLAQDSKTTMWSKTVLTVHILEFGISVLTGRERGNKEKQRDIQIGEHVFLFFFFQDAPTYLALFARKAHDPA